MTMNSLEFIDEEIKQLEERKESAFKNEYYSIYKECSQKINTLQQIKSELEVLQILTKCIRVSTISYDDNDVSKNSYNYSLETDELTIEEFNTLDNYYKALEVKEDE